MVIKTRSVRWVRHVARMLIRNAYISVVVNPEERKRRGRPRSTWEDPVEIHHKDKGYERYAEL
jgi:hypothetical protein